MVNEGIVAFWFRHRFLVINFIVGAVELTLELTATRIIAPYIGLTIYVWTSVIGIILASLALGYLIGGRLADKRKSPMDVVYLLLSSAILIGIVNTSKDPLLASLSQQHISLQLKALLASCLLFAAPTILLGSISPYLARLSINKIVSSGTQVSRINAAGTFGALFGTFFTGFYLFTLVGTRNILSLLGFSLLITSFFISPAKFNKSRWLLCLFALFCLLTPSQLYISGVSKDLDTSYGRYMIRDLGLVRVLQGDSLAWQSGIYKNNVNEPYFPYIRVFSDVSVLAPKQTSYLVIGGGAFTLPGIFERTHPQADVDVVEIDNQLLPISEKYFGFVPAPETHVFAEDGRQYLNGNRKHYDMIYLDAFSNSTPPFQLLTWQATDRLKSSLADGGIVAVNILSKPGGSGTKYVSSIARTYRKSFTNVRLFRVDKTAGLQQSQNILLLASQKNLQPAIDTLAAKNPRFATVSRGPLTYKSTSGILFSDDFAPVEQMVATRQ